MIEPVHEIESKRMSDRQGWGTVIELITQAPSAIARVCQYVSDPGEYVAKHEDELADRGIDGVDQLRGAIVIVDALESTGEVAYLDWKSPAEDVIGLLSTLPRIASAGVDLAVLVAADEGAEVEVVVGRVNALLSGTGVTVVVLDEGSDAYPLVAVADEAVGELTAVASALGVEVRAPRAGLAEVERVLRASAPPVETDEPSASSDDRRDRRVDSVQLARRRELAEKTVKTYVRTLPDAVKAGYGKRSDTGTLVPVELAVRLRAGYASGQKLHVLAKQAAGAARTYAQLFDAAAPMLSDDDWAMYLTFDGNTELVLATVELLSWAVALGDRGAVRDIVSAAPVVEAGHPVIARLAGLVGVEAEGGGELPHPEYWETWFAVLDAAAGERGAALAERVETWPTTMWKHWFFSPEDDRYCGQFCLDAAPLAVCLDIDDGSARDLADYPRDLVDFVRSRR